VLNSKTLNRSKGCRLIGSGLFSVQVMKRSAQKNGSFQKLFALPAEEFLINDFACAIKRKILIQVKDVLNHVFFSKKLVGDFLSVPY
jgi:hypothetical protein